MLRAGEEGKLQGWSLTASEPGQSPVWGGGEGCVVAIWQIVAWLRGSDPWGARCDYYSMNSMDGTLKVEACKWLEAVASFNSN
jgi:hypothetical protein